MNDSTAEEVEQAQVCEAAVLAKPGVISRERVDEITRLCYQAGYHDGAFPKELTYSEQFGALRSELFVHDDVLRTLARDTEAK